MIEREIGMDEESVPAVTVAEAQEVLDVSEIPSAGLRMSVEANTVIAAIVLEEIVASKRKRDTKDLHHQKIRLLGEMDQAAGMDRVAEIVDETARGVSVNVIAEVRETEIEMVEDGMAARGVRDVKERLLTLLVGQVSVVGPREDQVEEAEIQEEIREAMTDVIVAEQERMVVARDTVTMAWIPEEVATPREFADRGTRKEIYLHLDAFGW